MSLPNDLLRRRRASGSPTRLVPLPLLGLLVAAPIACRSEPVRPPDVVLVSIDTLRADEPGCAGRGLPTTPQLDRFRQSAVMFTDVDAAAPSTLSSHASIFTGQIPQHHGASFARRLRLPESAVTLAEVLHDHGYQTLGFTAHGQMAATFGIGQGFEIYRARSERHSAGAFRHALRAALRRLDRARDGRPLFLFLHTYEIHHPYTPDPAILRRLDPDYAGTLGSSIEVDTLRRINARELAIDDADARHIRRAYDAELVSADAALGTLFQQLQRRGLWENAIVVITSDHGEEFGEHGTMGWHSHTLYEELLRVPLLARLPGEEGAGLEVRSPVRSIDIAPTILDLAGIPAPDSFDGRSLVPLIRGGSLRDLPSVAAIDHGDPQPGALDSVRWRNWKLIGGRLFDLARDPGERVDLAASEPARAAELGRLLAAAVAARRAGDAAPAEVDEKTERELRSLGYLN